MRKLLATLAILLYAVCFFAGCAAVEKTYSAYDACKRDPVCYSQMEKGRDLTSAISTAALASNPTTAPFATVAGSALGMLASLAVGVYLGKRKEK